jgi:hypothetical protein
MGIVPLNCATNCSSKSGRASVELLLGLAVIALVFQLSPDLLPVLLRTLDVTSWSRKSFYLVNLVVLISLVIWRFGPTVCDDWRNQREKNRLLRIKKEHSRKSSDDRKLYERMIKARERRFY